VTREFFEKVRELLRPETGMYLMNVIDIYQDGRFLGAIHTTLGKVFGANVYVFTSSRNALGSGGTTRHTYIIVGSLQPLDLADLGARPDEPKCEGSPLTAEQVGHLQAQADGVTLTDDYAPVENLLEIVVRRRMQR
jgi:hypothetical protein